MRTLNHIEKEYCIAIAPECGRGPGMERPLKQLIEQNEPEAFITINLAKKNTHIIYPGKIKNDELDPESNRTNLVIIQFVSIVNLLRILENEGLIVFYEDPEFFGNDILIGKRISNNYFGKEFKDLHIIRLAIRYSQSKAIITEDFLSFIQRDFQTQKDYLERKQLKTSRNSAWASMLAALAACVSAWLSYVQVHQKEVNEKPITIILRNANIKNLKATKEVADSTARAKGADSSKMQSEAVKKRKIPRPDSIIKAKRKAEIRT